LNKGRDPLTDNQRKCLEIIQQSAQHLQTITEKFFDAARIDAGQVGLTLNPTDLATLLKTVVAEFRPQLESKVQHLALRAQPGLPPALCDEIRTAQIINNLLSNAHKYTPQGGHLTLDLAPAAEAGFLRVSVADNGMGIASGDQVKLFNPFFRAERANLTEPNGTGLGLYIARALVELHHGRLWFESKLGQGSTFYVTLPIAEQSSTNSR
jgi:signal transduction histidine kinase